MSTTTTLDIERAREIWTQYQADHDIGPLLGKTAGIDPVTGRTWFGESALDVHHKMQADGFDVPVYVVSVGHDYYLRKVGRHKMKTAGPRDVGAA
jgi:hypothetical protein